MNFYRLILIRFYYKMGTVDNFVLAGEFMAESDRGNCDIKSIQIFNQDKECPYR